MTSAATGQADSPGSVPGPGTGVRPRGAAAWALARAGALGAAAVGAGAWAAPQGWPAVAGLAALAGLAVAGLAGRAGRTPGHADRHGGPAPRMVHTQASGLARQVVPVWQRNVDTARLHAEQNMGALTESFGSIIVGLDQALGGATPPRQLDGATIDELLARHRPEIEQLLAATRRIAQVKDDIARGAGELADTLVETTRLSKEVQTISRATHLLALNASVEAARASGGGGGGASAAGFAAVAQEVQHLAAQSRQAGQELARHLARMHDRVQSMKLQGARLDCDDDELMLQAEQQARALVWGLLASLSEVAQSQRTLRDAGQQVQAEMERILVGLQSQDRLNQMLQSVTEDMQRLHAWLEGRHDDAAASAHQWLERLESSYTMEEMRTSHHGTVQVEKASEVEFF